MTSTATARAILAVLLAVSLAVPAVPAAATPPGTHAASGPVKAARNLDSGLVLAKPRGAGYGVTAQAGQAGAYVLRVPAGESSRSYADRLWATGDYAYVEPDYVRSVTAYTATPNDPDFLDATNWSETSDGVTTLYGHAKNWWERGTASPGFDKVWPYLAADGDSVAYHARASAAQVKVAVIDTGFYMNHPDRGANIVAGLDAFASYDSRTGAFTTDGDVTPDSPQASLNDTMTASHGTMVASEIAQAAANGTGGTGAGYDTQVRVYKVQGIWVNGNPAGGIPAGSSVILDSAIIRAIYAATDDGCRVISMSLGGGGYSQALQDAITYAYNHGVLVVAATGNEGAATVSFPASAAHVVGVGSYRLSSTNSLVMATTPVRSDFSNYGTGTDILAPGQSIWGPVYPGWDADGSGAAYKPGYAWWGGTSMATPLVSAAAALVFRLMPSLSPDAAAGVLQSSARDIGSAGYDVQNGWGCLDMAAAYARLKSDYPNLAAPAVSSPAAGSTVATKTPVLAWSAVAGYGVEYGVSVDGGLPTTTTATALTVAALAEGTHVLKVTAWSPRNWSVGSSASVTLTVDTVPPAAPPVSYNAATRRVVWTDAETGTHGTELAIDTTASPVAVTGTFYVLPAGIPEGDHRVFVRMTDAAGNAGAWGSSSFTVTGQGSQPTTMATQLSLAASTLTLAYGASFSAAGTLTTEAGPVAEVPVLLERSTDDGSSWSQAASATTGLDGHWSLSYKPGRNVLLRARFAGDGGIGLEGTASVPVSVRQLVYLGTPSLSTSRVYDRHYFTAYGSLKPRFGSGSYPVKVRFYRYEKHSGKYSWTLKKTVSAKASNYSTYTRYSVRTTVPYPGSWKAVASYAGSGTYAATTSGTRYFTAH